MKASQHQSIGTLTGRSQMSLFVLTIQIKKRDKHLVYLASLLLVFSCFSTA